MPTAKRGATVTESSRKPDSPAPGFGGRAWTHFAWWLLAWNVAVPIRFIGMILDGPQRPGIERAIVPLILDQTSWAVATYLMFRLALRARLKPLRHVLTVLGALAV